MTYTVVLRARDVHQQRVAVSVLPGQAVGPGKEAALSPSSREGGGGAQDEQTRVRENEEELSLGKGAYRKGE